MGGGPLAALWHLLGMGGSGTVVSEDVVPTIEATAAEPRFQASGLYRTALTQNWPVSAEENVVIDMTFDPIVEGGIEDRVYKLFIGHAPGETIREVTGSVEEPMDCVVRFEFEVDDDTDPLTPGEVYVADVYRTDTGYVHRVAHARMPVAESPIEL
jgi:hypothetical protein